MTALGGDMLTQAWTWYPLKNTLSGFWSRRITDEQRQVCRVKGDALLIALLRFRY